MMIRDVLIKGSFALMAIAPLAGDSQNVASRTISGSIISLSALKHPGTINVFPDYNLIIIGDAGASFGTPVYHVYSMDSVKFIRSFMALGLGKNEVSSPADIQYFPKKRTIAFFDVNMQRYSLVSIDSVKSAKSVVNVIDYLGTKTPLVRPLKKVDQKLSRPLFLYRSQTIIDFNPDPIVPLNLLAVHNSTGNFIKHAGVITFITEAVDLGDQDGPFSGNLALSDNEQHIVYTSFRKNLICLFDSNGRLSASYKGSPDMIRNQENATLVDGTTLAYTCRSTRMKNKSVFAINANPGNKAVTNMYIFNEKLIPQERLMINPGIFNFDVDAKARKIYALNTKKELIILSY